MLVHHTIDVMAQEVRFLDLPSITQLGKSYIIFRPQGKPDSLMKTNDHMFCSMQGVATQVACNDWSAKVYKGDQ